MLISTLLLQYAFAIEPMSPIVMCEQRMTQSDQKKQCKKKVKSLKLDSYAATACNALNDDKKFLMCLQSISGGKFNPEAVDRCVESPDNTDDAIITCILSVKNKRFPAATQGGFQSGAAPAVKSTPKRTAQKSK